MQLRKLEDYLGVTLFERTNKAVHVTPVGADMVARARRVLSEADALLAAARAETEGGARTLNIGVIPTLSPYLLPWMLPAVHAAEPTLTLAIHEDITNALLDRLHDHRIDAALVALPLAAPDLEVAPLFDEPFLFACPREHRLAGGAPVHQGDLADERLLLLTDGHCLRDQALAVCGRTGGGESADARADFRATSLETIRQMVAAGAGCTLLPAMAVDRDPSNDVALRPLADGAARRIALVWRRSYPNAATLRRLAEIVRTHLPASVARVEPEAVTDDSAYQSAQS